MTCSLINIQVFCHTDWHESMKGDVFIDVMANEKLFSRFPAAADENFSITVTANYLDCKRDNNLSVLLEINSLLCPVSLNGSENIHLACPSKWQYQCNKVSTLIFKLQSTCLMRILFGQFSLHLLP